MTQLQCPLCSIPLGENSLESHLRLELVYPQLRCQLCLLDFTSDEAAQRHFEGPRSKHPGSPKLLLALDPDPAKEAKLEELIRLTEPSEVEKRLCICGQCQLLCREQVGHVMPQPLSVQQSLVEPEGLAVKQSLSLNIGEGKIDVSITANPVGERSLLTQDQFVFQEQDAASEVDRMTSPLPLAKFQKLETGAPRHDEHYGKLSSEQEANFETEAEEPEELNEQGLLTDQQESLAAREFPGRGQLAGQEAEPEEAVPDSKRSRQATHDQKKSKKQGNQKAGENAAGKAEKCPCLLCGQPVSRAAFKAHVLENHASNLPYICKLCPMKTRAKFTLAKHQRRDHAVFISATTFTFAHSEASVAALTRQCFGEANGEDELTRQPDQETAGTQGAEKAKEGQAKKPRKRKK